MEGSRARGRRRIGIHDLNEGSYEHMKRKAENREAWRSWLPKTCRSTDYN
jgi:hypothetical protein